MGGTEKMVQIMMKTFKEEGTFNHVLAYQSQQDRSREQYFREILGENKLIPYASYPEFITIVRRLQPFILHRYSAGIPEFPFIGAIKENTKHFVSTSVFGNQDDTIEIDRVLFVSKHIQHLANRFGEKYRVVRNAVEDKYSDDDLREELNIPKDAFVFGRIGRDSDDIYDPINLKAYSEIESDKTFFIIIGASQRSIDDIKNFKINNYRVIDRTTDEVRLSKFYNTMDVLAHARKDGECNPANIWEAFVHGKPVVSHYGVPFNGHLEVIKNCGFVVAPGDIDEYKRIMKGYVDGTIDYDKLSKNARKNYENTCMAADQAHKQLDIYKELKWK
jgi:glycosyltransferase involved in cell wall biosynthesis